MFLLMVWQKSQDNGIPSNQFCLLPWPLSTLYSLVLFLPWGVFFYVEKQEIWIKTLIYKIEYLRFHIY